MPYRDKLVTEMWLAAEVSASARDRRLRALCALAAFDPASPRWTDAGKLAAEALVAENPLLAATWVKALRPVRQSLLPGLQAVFHDRTRGDLQRSLATGILADYAAERPEVLADLLMDADDKQFAVIYPKLTELGEAGMPWLLGEVGKPMPDTDEEAKEVFAKRQANAAVALLKMNRPEKVWPLLKHGPDPRVRSYLIHRLAPLGADAGVVVRRLDSEPDLSIRRALLLALGEFQEADVPSEERESRLLKLREWYSTERDPGLHSAVEWLLRTWKEEAWLTLVNEKWARDKEQRETRLEGIRRLLTKEKEKTPPQWYVNGQGQTMVVVPGPVEFMMGSPSTEAGRIDLDERQHRVRIGWTFAVAAKPVTVEEYRKFEASFKLPAVYARMANLPIVGIDWYRAAKYCNWLSEREGIPDEQRRYEIKGADFKLKASHLSLGGYRLPMEAEMEYATRAGAITARYFGEREDLLPKYAWCLENSRIEPGRWGA